LGAIAASSFGQGTVLLSITRTPSSATRFIIVDPSVPGTGGQRIAGDAYWVQLFYANGTVTDENALVGAGAPEHPRTGAAAGALNPTPITLANVTPPGGPATVQLRAWSSALGTDYNAAFSAWSNQGPDASRVLGRSALFTVDTANPLTDPPEQALGLGEAFPGLMLTVVPEPSAIALAALGGLGALMLLRRRK
jgi:hypothetical protein